MLATLSTDLQIKPPPNMSALYPLRFQPLFKQYLWGGRRLGTVLNKPIGDGPTYAESWEIVDHGDDQSVVADGKLAGLTLHEVAQQYGDELYGCHHPQKQFPLLFKYLDAKRTLSVQVHPNDQQGALLDPPDLGKTEAWVVLAAEPGSLIYAGMKPGVDRDTLAKAIEDGTSDQCLHAFEPKIGDCVFIEAGTVHALGEGLMIAEIQQASNTTFRLFDWNRTDADGNTRPLHIEESLATIDFARGAVHAQTPQSTAEEGVTRLVQCDKFVLDRVRRSDELTVDLAKRFHLLSVIEGSLMLASADEQMTITTGETILVPACCEQIALAPQGECTWLDMYLPS